MTGMDLSAARTLLTVFQESLEVRDIDLDSRFYALGGDSLVAIRVVNDARARGLPITLRDLLVHQSVRGILSAPEVLDGMVDRAGGTAGSVAFALLVASDRERVPEGVIDAVPASALQSGMLYLSEASQDPMLYQSMEGWEVCERFDRDRFAAALDTLVRRHPVLRSAFDFDGLSVAAQLVWDRVEVPLLVEPATDAADAERIVLGRRAEGFGIDWRRPPLVRCQVVELPESFHVVLGAHHVILDGWSFTRLTTELMRLYGRPDTPLPDLDLAAACGMLTAERAAEADPAAADQWLAQADAAPMLPASTARVPDARAQHAVDLGADLVGSLSGVARMLGVPLKSVALAAHVRALATWTGRARDVVTGVVFNTRPTGRDSDEAIGLFLNTLPVRFSSVEDTWAGLISAAAAAEQAGIPHQAYPQAALVDKLGRPAFDVAFNFMNFHGYRADAPVAIRSPWRQGKPSFGCHVSVEITGGVGQLRVGFDPDQLSRASVEEFAALLEQALVAAAANPVSPAR